jgi:hypothetical protein
MSTSSFDLQETLQRIMKYLIEGLVIGLVAYLLPSKSLTSEEIVMLALTALAVAAGVIIKAMDTMMNLVILLELITGILF